MARQTILLILFTAFCLFFLRPLPKSLGQQQLPPAGTAVEYLDGAGRLQPAKFVEKTAAGQIKVKLPNGTTLSFPPSRVRVAPDALPDRTGEALATPKPKMAKLRTWTDVTGAFTVEAEFIGLADGKVELKKTDGKSISLPLDKLSPADRDIAKFLAESINPFETDVKDLTATITTVAAVWPAARETVFDVDQFPFVGLSTVPAEIPWRGSAELPVAPPPQLTTRSIAIPEYRDDSFWGRFDLLIDEPRQSAWVYQGIYRKIFATANPLYHVDRVNLRDGSLQSRILFAQRDIPLAIDPTGQTLVTASDEGRFHLWKISADKLMPLRSFVITKKSTSTRPTPIFEEAAEIRACFVDDQHLQVISESGIFTVRLTDLQPLHCIDARNGVLSPSRKQMVVGDHTCGLLLINPLTAKVMGRFKGPDTPEQKVGSYVIPAQAFQDTMYLKRVIFSQDGKELIQVGQTELRFFDLQTGQQIKAVGTPVSISGLFPSRYDQLQWGDARHIILNNRHVISTTKGTAIAQLANEFDVGRSFGGREWILFKDSDRKVQRLTLQSAALVNEEIVKRSDSNRIELLVSPGTKFTIVYEYAGGTPSEADQARIQKAVTERLDLMGAKLATDTELPDHFLKFGQIDNGPAYLHLGSLRRDEFYWWTMAPLPKEMPPATGRVDAFLQTIKQMPEQIRYYGQFGSRLKVTLTADGLQYPEN